jgi:hypothetical protein
MVMTKDSINAGWNLEKQLCGSAGIVLFPSLPNAGRLAEVLSY